MFLRESFEEGNANPSQTQNTYPLHIYLVLSKWLINVTRYRNLIGEIKQYTAVQKSQKANMKAVDPTNIRLRLILLIIPIIAQLMLIVNK